MSLSSSQPVRLYQFDRSATMVWRYTSADRTISYGGHEWAPQPIIDDGIRMTGEASADTLEITLPAALPVAQLFRATPPSEEIFVTIYDYDIGDVDAGVSWVGSVSAAKYPTIGQAQLVCNSLSASMGRDGLRLRYERSCPHSVYDGECEVDKTLHAFSCRVTALTGTTVTVLRDDWQEFAVMALGANRIQLDVPSALLYHAGRLRWAGVEWPITATDVDGWITSSALIAGLVVGDSLEIVPAMAPLDIYSYGASEWALDGTVEMRGIEVANASNLELIGGTYGLAVGDAITIYPGCDGLRSTCDERFNNLLNHGGFAHMPGESIYGKRLW